MTIKIPEALQKSIATIEAQRNQANEQFNHQVNLLLSGFLSDKNIGENDKVAIDIPNKCINIEKHDEATAIQPG